MPNVSVATQPPFAPTRRDWISLSAVLWVQAQNAFNDNFVKIVLIGVAMAVARGSFIGDRIEHILTALIPIPFILLAPIAGYFSDRYSKRQVIWLCVVAQLAIFIFIAVCVVGRNVPLAVFGFFLLAVQSTLFSPAKQGILKELVGSERLGLANGLMQMLTMVGILAGMWLGGIWFDFLLEKYNALSGVSPGNAWRAALLPIIFIGATCLVPLALSRIIEPTPSHPDTSYSHRIWVLHFVDLRYLFSHRKIRIVALMIAFYWFVANFVGISTVVFARDLFPDAAEGGITSAASVMMAYIGVGLMIGSTLVSILSRKHLRIGLAPLGGLCMAANLAGIGWISPGTLPWHLCLGALGFFSGFFLVPLSAILQDLPAAEHRGRVLAAANLLASLAGIIAISLSFGFRHFGLSPSAQILLLVVPMVLAALYVIRFPKIVLDR